MTLLAVAHLEINNFRIQVTLKLVRKLLQVKHGEARSVDA
jgi:hypothetical protein